MAMDFPDSPTIGDTFSSNGRTWEWDGTVWGSVTPSTVQDALDDKADLTYVNSELADKSDVGHTHPISDVVNLQNTLNSKQNVVSGITSTEISYLDGVTSNIQSQINGKADSSHTHSISDITNLQTSLNAKANLSGASFSGRVTATDATETNASVRNITIATGDPSGGSDGDVWLKYE